MMHMTQMAFLPPHCATAPRLLSSEQRDLAHFITQSREERETLLRRAMANPKTAGELICLMRYLRTL